MPCFKGFEECSCGSEECSKIYCFGCENKSCRFHISKEEEPKEEPEQIITLEKIEITKQPNKLKYKEGENFDKTGMEVTAIYSDNSKKTIENYNCFPTLTTALTTENKEIKITYTEEGKDVSTTVAITVNEQEKQTNSNTVENNTKKDNTTVQEANTNKKNLSIEKVNANTTNNATNNTTKDNTIKDGKIANTGAEIYIIPISIIVILGIFGFTKYKQYKDV